MFTLEFLLIGGFNCVWLARNLILLCLTVYCGGKLFADGLYLFKQPRSVSYIPLEQYDEEI